MEFRLPGFNAQLQKNQVHSMPSSSYTNFSNNAMKGEPVDIQREAIQRELEKEMIREKIIAEEVERFRVLQAEVRRREVTMGEEVMKSEKGFPSSFMPGTYWKPPPQPPASPPSLPASDQFQKRRLRSNKFTGKKTWIPKYRQKPKFITRFGGIGFFMLSIKPVTLLHYVNPNPRANHQLPPSLFPFSNNCHHATCLFAIIIPSLSLDNVRNRGRTTENGQMKQYGLEIRDVVADILLLFDVYSSGIASQPRWRRRCSSPSKTRVPSSYRLQLLLLIDNNHRYGRYQRSREKPTMAADHGGCFCKTVFLPPPATVRW
ncbi:unnamed protein product [Lactuca saligna]|uniref:Uncharacterized protein n=1 Tax=Lactuca saligna TaxID=75948 RepID=A0AA35Z4P5_LACSI|nr:unnamed protein product [Lactuca saligna]